MKPQEDIMGKGENAGNQHFLLCPILTMFSNLNKRNLNIYFLSFAIAFHLDIPKIL